MSPSAQFSGPLAKNTILLHLKMNIQVYFRTINLTGSANNRLNGKSQ